MKGVQSQGGLYEWLDEEAQRDGGREALIETRDGGDVVLTVGELASKSRAFAAGLLSIGVELGDTVAIWLPNQSEWLVAEFACAAIGATVLGLNTRHRSHELAHLFATVPVKAIVLLKSFLGIDFLATMSASLPGGDDDAGMSVAPHLIFVGEVPVGAGALDCRATTFNELSSRGHWLDSIEPNGALANLFTTSGSTSAPKIAGHDQRSIVRHSFACARALDVQRGDRILGVLPLCGVFGFNSVMAVLFGEGAAILLRSFEVNEAVRRLVDDRVTHVMGGDDLLGAIFDAVPDGTPLPSLRRGGVANFAGHAKDVVLLANERWGVPLSGVYGSSELFALAAIWPAVRELSVRSLQGGVLVDEGIEVRIVDVASGEPVAEGDSGELQFRGYNAIDGYVNNPSATEGAMSRDGWFSTGDLGYLQGDGLVYQCRAREALRLRGFLVEPGEIEEYLSLNDGVEEVHVVGVDTTEGTIAFAFVKTRSGHEIDEAMILSRAKVELAGYKIPARVVAVESFPTTAGTNGTKVRLDELRRLALELLDA